MRYRLRQQRGMSLIEVSAAMTASMVLMGATLTTLVALQQADRQQSARADDQRVVAVLVDRLRDDLHAATSFTWNEDDGSLHMTPEAGEVAYQRAHGRWLRTGGDGLKSAYRLPPKLRLRVDPNEGSVGDLVTIQFYSTRKPSADEAKEPVLAELTAAVGRDGRLLVE